jgi:heme-degrading monooxygenase HmoA
MFTRVVTFTGATDIDAGLRYLQDTVVPLLREQNGFRGVTASADRQGAVLGVLTLWETEADRDASESTLTKARAEAQRVVGGQITVEHFEELLVDVVKVPAIGSALLVRRISMDPSRIDENLDFFRREVLPVMRSSAGFCAVRTMVNRQTGDGATGTVWTDRGALDAWVEASEARRRNAADRGVTFRELSKREVIFAELR